MRSGDAATLRQRGGSVRGVADRAVPPAGELGAGHERERVPREAGRGEGRVSGRAHGRVPPQLAVATLWSMVLAGIVVGPMARRGGSCSSTG